MTDDQKPFDDDLSFDDVPVVPKDSRALDEGDDFLDEVEDSRDEADFLTGEQPDAEAGAGFAVHRGGAEVFGGGRPAGGDVPGIEPTASEEGPDAEELMNVPATEATWIDDPEIGPGPSVETDGPHDAEVESLAEARSGEGSEAGAEAECAEAAPFDDVFVIEFGELDAESGEPAEDAEDLLLTPMAAVHPSGFGDDSADAANAFREDHAGWLGEDLPLDEFVGERVAGLDESLHLFEDDAATDEDPFAIDEVELEVEGAEETETDDGDFSFLDATESDAVQGDHEDAWAALADGESWVLGADLAGAAFSGDVDAERAGGSFERAEDHEEDTLAPVFGMGRFDPSLEDRQSSDGFFEDDENAEDGEPEYVDPIYGDVGAGIDEIEPQPYDERAEDHDDFVEDGEFGDGFDDTFDDTFVEQEPSHGRIIGVFRGAGRSPWARVAAALLVSIGAAGATVATMRPEWLGLVPGAVAPERVAVARPEIRIEPVAQAPDVVDRTATPAGVGDPAAGPEAPVAEPLVAVETPLAEPTVPPAVPMVETAPMTPVGVGSGSVTHEEAPSVVRPVPAPAFVGFETRDGTEILDLTDPVPSRLAGVQVVSPGERAFAQLRNAEIFVGVVKRVEASFVTLDLEPGEVSLSRSALTTLTPLASTDATEMLAAQHGYVRLPSEARLWGQILRNSTNDDVILQTEDARIRVPRGSVVQLQGSDPARTALVDAQDDSWLDARIREQLRVGGDDSATRTVRRR
jgi:hypothetical protein